MKQWKRNPEMNVYSCYIKSHCEFPDWEQEIEAKSFEEALEQFSKMTHWSEKELRPHVYHVSGKLC